MHIRCFAHILNLIMQNELKSMQKSIAKVWNDVRDVRASRARIEKFHKWVENQKIKAKCLLSLDIPSKWNSTYHILHCALKIVRAFERFEEENGHNKHSFCEVDWNWKKRINPSDYLD